MLRADHEEGEHAFSDAGRSLSTFAGHVQSTLSSGAFETHLFLLESGAGASEIAIKVVSVRRCPGDPRNPIIFLLFNHETRDYLAKTSPLVDVTTVSASMRLRKAGTLTGVSKISCPLDAQQLILRQLLYNARRLQKESKNAFSYHRTGPLLQFIPSFMLPLRPISPSTLGHLSNLKLFECSATNCPGSFTDTFVCSRCTVARYCSTSCQSRDYRKHTLFCQRISSSKTVSFEACPPAHLSPQFASILNVGMSLGDMRMEGEQHTEAIRKGFTESRKKRPGRIIFLIKVQVPPGDSGPLLVYDQDRTFKAFVFPPTKGSHDGDAFAYQELKRLGKECTRWRGLKVFLFARHTENTDDTRLEVLTGPGASPGQEVSW